MTNKFRWMLLTMATLGLFACSDNLTDSGTQPGPENVSDGFVAFKIGTMNAGTRAGGDSERDKSDGGYSEGADNEYAITDEAGANVALFFNASGNYLNKSYLQPMFDEDANGDHYVEDKYIEKVYSARIRKGDRNNNSYCVLILNAKPQVLEDLAAELTANTNGALATLMTKIDNSELGQYGKFFTMSNTVYVNEKEEKDDDGEVVKQANEVQGPVLITPKQIYDTWQEAQNHKIQVHVERLVAKFGLTYGKEAITDANKVITPRTKLAIRVKNGSTFSDGETTDWQVKITGWGVNGTETATYWVKNLNDGANGNFGFNPTATLGEQTTAFGKWNMSYRDGVENQPGTFGWNDPSRVRSYWAVDPHYNGADDVYPQQYRDADNDNDHTILVGHGVIAEGNKYPLNTNNVLNYISYNALDMTPNKYAPENTFGDYSGTDDIAGIFGKANGSDHQFTGEGYKRTSTHVLIAAELLSGGANEEKLEYCYGGVYWTQAVAGDNNKDLIEYMVNELLGYYGQPLYYNTGKQDGNGYDIYKQFTVEDATTFFELVPATVKGGDGSLMLAQKENTEKENFDLYKAAKGSDTEGTKDVYDNAKNDLQLAIYDVGVVKHFKDGKMYYAVPIQHMVAIDKDEKENNLWSIGSYGVVRNHWYKVNLTAISKPGTPVDDPDQPIIPSEDPEESGYAAFEIVIVPWHVINQDVEF